MDWAEMSTSGEPATSTGDPTRDLSGSSLRMLPAWEVATEGPVAAPGNARSPFFSDFVEAD